jgi:hypothetical protein
MQRGSAPLHAPTGDCVGAHCDAPRAPQNPRQEVSCACLSVPRRRESRCLHALRIEHGMAYRMTVTETLLYRFNEADILMASDPQDSMHFPQRVQSVQLSMSSSFSIFAGQTLRQSSQ